MCCVVVIVVVVVCIYINCVFFVKMADGIQVGEKRETTICVTEKDTAAQYGSGLAPVLSTPHVAGVFETACKELLDGHLKEGQSSVGASITVMERIALVNGPVQFCGAKVAALDLRAGAAMVLAGLAADGVTTIKCANRIERGYEKIVEKLRAVGAEIDHVPDDEDHVVSDGDE